METKKGQVTIFIIIAVVIVAGVILFFMLRGNIFTGRLPASLQPAYDAFLSCLEDDTLVGVELLEFQGGYISLPDLEFGSAYMPFSSQLNFLGNPIPYWYYVSGNGIPKEQVPSKSSMENELEEFVDSRIRNCILDEFFDDGFDISQGEPSSVITIRDNSIDINLDMRLAISKADESATVRNHRISVSSRLGSLYDDAKAVYDTESRNLFLENYTIDVLRLYSPVDGIELSCSPIIWNADEVFDELKEAIEINTLALTAGSGIKGNEYFFVDLPVENEIRFVNSRNWSNTFEVNPSDGNLLIADPIGNQPGLGIIGFCYVPYHFVYDLRYPVLVQVYDSSADEFFQFPMAVVVDGNKPRMSTVIDTALIQEPELCEFKNVLTSVNVRDADSSPVDAEISYECFSERCRIGETTNGNLQEEFPQCVNGFVVAKADGFKETRQLYSTVDEGNVNVILDKLHNLNVDLKVDGVSYSGEAIVTFSSDNGAKTVNYPDSKRIELSEGIYDIQVYVFKDSSFQLQGGTKEQCVSVSGFDERCFEIEIPNQLVSSVLSGGGQTERTISDFELTNSNTIEIDMDGFTVPKTLEQLQNNYLLFENKDLTITFR